MISYKKKTTKNHFLNKEGHENGQNTMENVVKYNITFRVFILFALLLCCCWTYSQFCATH